MTTRYLLLALSDDGRAEAYMAPNWFGSPHEAIILGDCATVAAAREEASRDDAQVFEVNAGSTNFSIDVMRMGK